VREQTAARTPVVAPGHTPETITAHISAMVLQRPRRGWRLGLILSVALMLLFFASLAMLVVRGVGVWGINVPVGWGVDISNFVWWVGIGHAGTLISAVLLLFRQRWRTSINRFAEAMTLFAILCATLYPLLHLGRPWFFYWLMPYPSNHGVWPQFRSPLVWDMFALATYGTVSLLFWYIGLMPDLATLRDRARGRLAQIFYGFLSMGWRGSARHWQRYETAYFLMAALAAPLVVSVHTIVSLDFAVSVLPGWHTTIFPPYFVAGALFSGLAMVITLAIPLRAAYRLHDFITDRHLHNLARLMLASGLFVAYSYLMEAFTAWYSSNLYESSILISRATGPYALGFWVQIVANVVVPQALWLRRARENHVLLFFIALIVNVGMWFERFIIIASSLSRDFLPSAWGNYAPTVWDWATYIGTIGLFLTLLFIFLRLLPAISIFEMSELVEEETEAQEEKVMVA
jgi:molybdopterin-containing oxidoreductase family membrane subunit